MDEAEGDGAAMLERAERIVVEQDVEAITSFFGKKQKAAERKSGDKEALQLFKVMKGKKRGVIEALKALWRRQCGRGDGGEVDVAADAFWAKAGE